MPSEKQETVTGPVERDLAGPMVRHYGNCTNAGKTHLHVELESGQHIAILWEWENVEPPRQAWWNTGSRGEWTSLYDLFPEPSGQQPPTTGPMQRVIRLPGGKKG